MIEDPIQTRLATTVLREDVFDRSIEVLILRPRRKPETGPRAPRVIQIERGVGYVSRYSAALDATPPPSFLTGSFQSGRMKWQV
jgi:hypothetical protein